jgi:hypothetical protein
MGARPISTKNLSVGAILAFDHAVWRVVEKSRHPDDRERPWTVVLRPIAITGDDPRARDHDQHLATPEYYYGWQVYPAESAGHYPVCATCHEPMPCRDQMAERVSAASAADLERYTIAGVCPACEEPVSSRQKRMTWPDNAAIPGGPPVTFHLRGQCFGSAMSYEKRWHALDPDQRRRVLSCTGHVINHNDGTYECSEFDVCPGPQASHPSYTVCRCPDCHAHGSFGCHPDPKAKLIDRRMP